MNRILKVMFITVLCFGLSVISLDASTTVKDTNYSNGTIKTKTYYENGKRTKMIEYNTKGEQIRSYRYDTSGRKQSAYEYKYINIESASQFSDELEPFRIIEKKWSYYSNGNKKSYVFNRVEQYDSSHYQIKKVKEETYYSNGKRKSITNYSRFDGSKENKFEYPSKGSTYTKYDYGMIYSTGKEYLRQTTIYNYKGVSGQTYIKKGSSNSDYSIQIKKYNGVKYQSHLVSVENGIKYVRTANESAKTEKVRVYQKHNGKWKRIHYSYENYKTSYHKKIDYYLNGKIKVSDVSRNKGNIYTSIYEIYYSNGKLKRKAIYKYDKKTQKETSTEYYYNTSGKLKKKKSL